MMMMMMMISKTTQGIVFRGCPSRYKFHTCTTGKNGGEINGKRYFVAQPNHGIFVRLSGVSLVPPGMTLHPHNVYTNDGQHFVLWYYHSLFQRHLYISAFLLLFFLPCFGETYSSRHCRCSVRFTKHIIMLLCTPFRRAEM